MSKKLVAVWAGLLTAMVSLCPLQGKAAPRELSLGVAGGYASYNDGGYAKVYFHYEPINHLRLAPEVGYIFKSHEKSGIELAIDVHAPFRVWRGISVYPLAGFTVNQWKYDHAGNVTCAGADLGGGIDLFMTSNLKVSLQAKYSILKKRSGCFVDLGVGYVF